MKGGVRLSSGAAARARPAAGQSIFTIDNKQHVLVGLRLPEMMLALPPPSLGGLMPLRIVSPVGRVSDTG